MLKKFTKVRTGGMPKQQTGEEDVGFARGIKTKRKGVFGRSTENLGKVNNGGDALRLDW